MDKNDRTVVGLAMISHALVHTYELTIPVLMVIWLAEFPITAATLGIVVSAGYALFGIGALPSGILSDRVGSQWMIAACLLGMGLSFVLLSFATNLLVIAAAICLWGVAASIYHPAGLSLLSTGVKDRGTGFGYHGMAGNAGIALGPLVAIVLLWFVEWRLVALILAVPAFLAIAVILKADIDENAAVSVAADGSGNERQSDIRSVGELVTASRSLFAGGFLVVFLVIVFNGLYYRGILTFLPELLADFMTVDLPLEEGSRLAETVKLSDFVYVGLLSVGIAGQYVGGKAIDRVPVEKGLLVGYSVLIVVALLFVPAIQAGLLPIVAVSLLLDFFLFMLQPIYQVAVSEYSPADARGLSYGYTYLAQFGVGALGAAIIGIVLTYSVPETAFFVVSGFAVVAAIISSWLYSR
jgi:MFS family permease